MFVLLSNYRNDINFMKHLENLKLIKYNSENHYVLNIGTK